MQICTLRTKTLQLGAAAPSDQIDVFWVLVDIVRDATAGYRPLSRRG